MIAVIADDLTGAGELAGVGLRHGLSAEVQTAVAADCDADLLVVDSATRSLSASRAAAAVEKICDVLKHLSPGLIYKKTDSVLRGHVVTEIQTLLTCLGKSAALLVPANPSAGRTIVEGDYLIDGCPLHETDFSHDPEFPARSSKVLDLLGPSSQAEVRVLKPSQSLPKSGISVGDAVSAGDLQSWARQLAVSFLPAGGAEFFAAVLEAQGMQKKPATVAPGSPFAGRRVLCVNGTSSGQGTVMMRQAERYGFPVCRLPGDLRDLDETCLQRWSADIVASLDHSSKVMAAIDKPIARDSGIAVALTQFSARLVERVLKLADVNEVIVAGGSTASAIAHRLGWSRLQAVQELVPGTVRMQIYNQPIYLTVKPGSYAWPSSLWETDENYQNLSLSN